MSLMTLEHEVLHEIELRQLIDKFAPKSNAEKIRFAANFVLARDSGPRV